MWNQNSNGVLSSKLKWECYHQNQMLTSMSQGAAGRPYRFHASPPRPAIGGFVSVIIVLQCFDEKRFFFVMLISAKIKTSIFTDNENSNGLLQAFRRFLLSYIRQWSAQGVSANSSSLRPFQRQEALPRGAPQLSGQAPAL